MTNNYDTFIFIINTHIKRMQEALEILQRYNTFPVDEKSLSNLNHQQILNLEMLTSRFSKLQDYLGAKIFDLFFVKQQESINGLTMLDKLNKLEKFNIIPDASVWKEMRHIRNVIEHEYPDNPTLIVQTLNALLIMCPILWQISNNLIVRIQE